jgi:hypothetical protein
MKNLFLLFFLCLGNLFSQVTVSFSYPMNGATIGGGGIQLSGPVASSAAAITSVTISINGGAFGGFATLFGSPPNTWLMSLQGSAMTAGATTLQLKATDAMSNTGLSSIINVTVIHSNPQCSHTTAPGSSSIFCEKAVTNISTSTNTARSVTLTGGLTAGQLIFCQAEASVPASPATQLTSSVTAGATLIHVVSSAGFPATPFFATLSPIGGLGTGTPQVPTPEDTVTVTNVSGLNWTVTAVPQNHASGEIVGNWSVVQGQSNYPWKSTYLTDSLGIPFTFYNEVGTRATDNDVEQMGTYYAFVPASTGSNEVITSQNPNGSGQVNLLQCALFSGVNSVGNGAYLMGWAGQNDGSTVLPGPAYVNPFIVTPGDLIVTSVFAAPIVPLGTAQLAIEDTSKPYGQINYFVATSSPVQPETSANVDGFFEVSIAFHPTGFSSGGVQAFITEPYISPRPGEKTSQLALVAAQVTTSTGTITNVDVSFDNGPYNATFGPMALEGGSSWNAQLDARIVSAGSHTLQVRATDSFGNIGYSSPATPIIIEHIPFVCAHTQVGPPGTGYFCEQYAAADGVNPQAITFPAVAGVGLRAGQTIILQTSMGNAQVFQTTNNGAIDNVQTSFLLNGACSSFPATPFDVKVNEHAGYGAYGRVEKMTVHACTGSTASSVTRGVPGNDCVIPSGELSACSIAIAHDNGAWVNRWGAQTPDTTNITSTHGFTWTAVKRVSSGPFADLDDANGAIWYTVVPSNISTDEVITFTDAISNFSIVLGVVYTGLGALEPGAVYTTNLGGFGSGSASTGPYFSQPGDINIALIGGAPESVIPSNPITNVRAGDTVRPYSIFADQYSVSSIANIGTYMGSEGASVIGMAFQPAAPSTFGRSIVLSSQTAFNNSIPGIPSNGVCTMEISMHDWGNQVVSEHPIQNNICDINTYWFAVSGGNPQMLLTPLHNTGAGDCQVNFTGHNLVTIRWQRIPATGSTGTIICQATDETGNTFVNMSTNYTGITGPVTTNGFTVGGTTTPISYAYARVYGTNFSATATPPTTAQDQTGAVFQWKFDLGNNVGSLNDSTAGNTHPATLSSGSPTYVNTAYQNLIKALPRTLNAPAYTKWLPFKVNATNTLDGSTSYTQANASPNVSVTSWTNVSGPVTPIIVSPSALVTNVTGLTQRGGYTYNLHVVDTSSNSADAQLLVGAVDYDANGVLVQTADEKKIYGDQIVWGKNPWGYADERNCTAVNLQINGTNCNGDQIQASGNAYFSTTTWLTPATGTVSYPFAGYGPSPGQACLAGGVTKATLNGSITSSATSILIHHSECLDLTSFPTWILIGNTIGNISGVPQQEQVCISSSGGVFTGDATLAVCYDGRGMAGANLLNAQPLGSAQMWADTTIVGQFKITGSGTKFYSDPARPICPAGVPGPPGPVAYYIGQAAFTAGSSTATLSGFGAAWTTLNGVVAGGYIRANATHASGTPFAFWAKIVSVTDPTHLVMDRPAPTGIDAGPFNYAITATQFLSLDWIQNSHAYRSLWQGSGCASETAAFGVPSHDVTSLDSTVQSGVNISYKNALGAISSQGPNFYATGRAERQLEHRSGYTPALTAANQIDDNYVRDPEVSGIGGGSPLLNGGGIIGSIIDKIFNGSTPLDWLDVTPFASQGVAEAAKNCNTADPRDQGYPQGWLGLVALKDPNFTRQMTWTTGLQAWATRDQTCRRNATDGYAGVQVNSWAGSSIGGIPGAPLTLTNGSKLASPTTGTFSPGICAGVDDGTGTIHVIVGSTIATVVTGNVAAGGFRITITDTSVSPPLVVTREYSGSGGMGSTITLAGAWTGLTTGDYTFMVEDGSLQGYMTSIGNSNLDWPDVSVATGLINNRTLQHFYACQYNSPTQITLNRSWDQLAGTTTNNYMVSYVVSGFEVQPFMLGGIKASGTRWAGQNSDPTVSSAYSIMNGQLGTWIANFGSDLNSPGTLGIYYNRVSGDCEVPGVPNPSPTFDSIHGTSLTQPSCGFMGLTTTTGGQYTARVNTAEAITGYEAYYDAQCALGISQCNTARAFVDKYYGAVYGDCSMTQGGGSTFYCDAHFVNTQNELSNAFLGGIKWTGFFFGMGNSARWPAHRLNAGIPTSPKVQFFGGVYDLGGVHN